METVPDAETGEDARPRAKDGARETGPALEAHYRFILWLVPVLERLPKSRKFLLGDRMQDLALEVLERLVEATYTRSRAAAAGTAGAQASVQGRSW